MILSGDTTTSPTVDFLWFATSSIYTFQGRGSYKEIIPTDFPSMLGPSPFSSNDGLANSAIKSARTQPFIEVRNMYLISKAPRIVLQPFLCSQLFKAMIEEEVGLGPQQYEPGSNVGAFAQHALLPKWPSLVVGREPLSHVMICLHNIPVFTPYYHLALVLDYVGLQQCK